MRWSSRNTRMAQQKYSDDDPEEEEKNKKFRALDEGDIALLKTYVRALHS